METLPPGKNVNVRGFGYVEQVAQVVPSMLGTSADWGGRVFLLHGLCLARRVGGG